MILYLENICIESSIRKNQFCNPKKIIECTKKFSFMIFFFHENFLKFRKVSDLALQIFKNCQQKKILKIFSQEFYSWNFCFIKHRVQMKKKYHINSEACQKKWGNSPKTLLGGFSSFRWRDFQRCMNISDNSQFWDYQKKYLKMVL